MRTRPTSLLLSIALAGCATGAAVIDDQRLASISPGQRVQVSEAQTRVEEAQVDVTNAQVARDAAKDFLAVANAQGEAAQSRLRAEPIDNASDAQAVATRSKREYAERLLRLRDAELKVKRDELAVARAGLELAKARALGVRDGSYLHAIDRAQGRLSADQQLAANRSAEVGRLRLAWDGDRRAAEGARMRSLEHPVAPPPAAMSPPATGANEGPTEGFQHLPTDNFSR